MLQRIDHPDAAAAHAQALEDLKGAANGLVLVGAGSVGAHPYGLLPASNTIEVVLDRIILDTGISIDFDVCLRSHILPRAFASYVARQGIRPEHVNVRFGLDPLGGAILGGGFPVASELLDKDMRRLVDELAAAGFRRWLMAADGRIVHDAGGTEAQELAYVLASGVAMLRALEAGGIAVKDARHMLYFRLTADTDQLITIAKLRALRRLWQRVEGSCGLAPEPAFISAETAWRTITRNDSTMNIVRATCTRSPPS